MKTEDAIFYTFIGTSTGIVLSSLLALVIHLTEMNTLDDMVAYGKVIVDGDLYTCKKRE
jgi:purine-cytosine permease-like protein|tara:strand:- start:610 stop:786 length:177 start_codon:yes stop_codon:yes gene_type:complete